ncbi:hypothetical protein A5482_014760 (plasmid) [Cyanobacterium sp. IPPAS B-1200]|uniref:hypothetical protein n=1 Tax=Cyanobacterium sp. IPPAS B-1200 TaxID=1562720 RepID=UPI001372915C|nr:hypothetical protein [Cyanobacterium sp. IPPAS B-1200]
MKELYSNGCKLHLVERTLCLPRLANELTSDELSFLMPIYLLWAHHINASSFYSSSFPH